MDKFVTTDKVRAGARRIGGFVGVAALTVSTLTVIAAVPASAASNPAANVTWVGDMCAQTGTASPNASATCLSADLNQIDAVRATEGIRPMYLPANYLSLSGPEQLFVVTNLERVDRGLSPVAGLTAPLDSLSAQGAGHGIDPPFPAQRTWGGAIWAGGYATTLETDFAWMYDDGFGSDNLACTAAGDAGCWGHRDNILADEPGTMTGGAATGLGKWGSEYAMLFIAGGAPDPYVYTWSQAVAEGAGAATSSVTTPAPVPVRPAGWQVPTRVAGSDRVGTAVAISQATWGTLGDGGRGAEAVVIARDDQFPDALAAVPLAQSVTGPILLTTPASLDPRDLSEINRILAPGGNVFLIGGTGALSPAIADTLSSAGFNVNRIAGGDRYATAVAIADELADPTTVFEVDGNTFADALSAGPAAAANHAAILLTDGTSLPSATAAYLQEHSPARWAIGGPAASADPEAKAVAGSDRYETSAMVAFQFFATPVVIGVATGETFPDALAAGAQLAVVGGPLLLVETSAVPDPITAYIQDDLKAPIAVYGGLQAVSNWVTGVL